MSEKTKDTLGYTAAALMLVAAGYFLYQILEPFYYGFGGGLGWIITLFGS